MGNYKNKQNRELIKKTSKKVDIATLLSAIKSLRPFSLPTRIIAVTPNQGQPYKSSKIN